MRQFTKRTSEASLPKGLLPSVAWSEKQFQRAREGIS